MSKWRDSKRFFLLLYPVLSCTIWSYIIFRNLQVVTLTVTQYHTVVGTMVGTKICNAFRTVYSLAIKLADCFFNTDVSPKTVFVCLKCLKASKINGKTSTNTPCCDKIILVFCKHLKCFCVRNENNNCLREIGNG